MEISRKAILLLVVASVAAGYGLRALNRTEVPLPSFHDIRINAVDDYKDILAPYSPELAALAAELKTPERAYEFVRDKIKYMPFIASSTVEETLHQKKGSCMGKAALLYSLYRSMGIPSDKIRIIVGILITSDGPADHVWLDMEYEGKCLQQDPSGMIGKFGFYDFPGTTYVEKYVMKELFCFNEKGLAHISQLNRFRNGSSPMGHRE
jgi:hypothetical protein